LKWQDRDEVRLDDARDRRKKSELFFCEQKRSKKNLDLLRAFANHCRSPALNKSFLVVFFKKGRLACLPVPFERIAFRNRFSAR